MEQEMLMQMKNIVVKFPGVIALNDVSISINKGSVHAIMGENGAGKSTLMKVLIGDRTPDYGEIFFEGKPIEKIASTGKHKDISMIYQELNPIKDMTIAENIFMGRFPEKARGIVDLPKTNELCQKIFDEWDLPYDPRQKMNTLSIASIQMIEIIKAISKKSKLIIMDEPTSAITPKEVEKLFSFIRELKNNGISVIYISHKLDEIYQIADHVTILRDGEKKKECAIEDITREEMISCMVGRDIKNVYYKKEVDIGEEILEVKALGRKNVFSDVSFSLRKGEVLGFSGVMGAGRTEIMRCIFGLDQATEGSIFVDGKRLNVKKPMDAINAGIAMLTEDRKGDGLVLCRSIRENIALASLNKMSRYGFMDKKTEDDKVNKAVEELMIKAHNTSVAANNLSGGNQQKVVFAKWLLKDPKILILDEPTRGIDVGAKTEIYHIISRLAENGVAVIFISSELPELLGVSDRVAVVASGRLVDILDRKDATQERIMELAAKGEK